MAKKIESKTVKKIAREVEVKKADKALDFKSAFKYPFNRPVGMLNILWFLLPIIGWFALMGYSIRIVKHFIKNDFKELPLFNFGESFKLGFFMFLKMIPFIIVIVIVNVVVGFVPKVGVIANLFINLFIIPILVINFFNKETIESYFELGKIQYVFENFLEYIIAILKSIALAVIFIIMSVILVGIPAQSFTKNIFLADFYRRYVK